MPTIDAAVVQELAQRWIAEAQEIEQRNQGRSDWAREHAGGVLRRTATELLELVESAEGEPT